MTRKPVAVVVLAMALVAAGALALQVGATTGDSTVAQSVTVSQAQVQQQAGAASFGVASVSAPESAAPGENVTVVALVENPSSETQAQAVEFRLEGDVVDRKRVAVAPEGVEPVRFRVDTTGLDPGEYVHSVYTEGDGVDAVLTVSESFAVSDLDAPANVTAGDVVTVNASVSNPNEFGATQQVAFRLGGSPLVERSLTLGAGNSTTFSAQVNTSGVEPGSYTHGVFARDVGEIATIDVEAAPGLPTDASVTFSDQFSDGTTVVVDSVALPDRGFVTIHDASLLDGDTVGSVIGVSDSLDAGTYESVSVDLFDVPGAEFDQTELTENQTLIAMPHLDTNDNGVYDFVNSNGFVDGPYLSNGSAVTDAANVTLVTETPTNDTETPTNDTETPTNDTETPTNDTETPDEETPDEETPGEETPDEETPGEETPDEETPDEETPSEETPDEETPAEETPDEETPGEETPDEETPADGGDGQ